MTQRPIDLPGGLRLRTLKESDLGELHALIERDREHLARWLPWAAGQELQGTAAFIAMTRSQLLDNNGWQPAIERDGAIIGVVGSHFIEWSHRRTSIGYWLAHAHQGHGVMTTAVRALVGHCFTTWGLHRVEIRAATGNARSRAIPERLGFTQEGVAREAERVGAEYLDLVIYSMLEHEWPGG